MQKGGRSVGNPKQYFDNEAEMHSLVKEWQKRLWLSDWWIGVNLCSKAEMPDDNSAGYSEVQWVNKCGTISILRKEDLPTDLMVKQPQELTLIHELLHFKFFELEPKSLEEYFYDTKQHQLLEELAKSLYMSKYGIGYEWFISDSAHIKA